MSYDPLFATFHAEADEILVSLERQLVEIASGSTDPAVLEEIYRDLHTLKGGAACVGLEAIPRAVHHLEDLVYSTMQHRRAVDPVLAALLVEAIDVLADLAHDATLGRDEPDSRPVLALVERALAATAAQQSSTTPGAAPESTSEVSETRAGAVVATPRTIRVEVARLDHAMELAGGLTVARGRLGDAIARSDLHRAGEAMQAADGLIRDLELQILALRLVPLRASFERLHRAVRDLGHTTAKEVRLELRCDDVEVDMAVAEALSAPLTHLLRNAIDHGIESPAQRIARGKPREGTISLSAWHEGGHLVVELVDDGGGLDRDRLVARAKSMGFASTELPDEQVWELAFLPGLSTAPAINDMSGRGIGMDVVRRSIEGLRGSVHLHSSPGAGVTVTLHLPLALSIIHGLAVEVGDEVFVLPVDSVIECVELDRERAICSSLGGVLELRGDALPYARLADQFGTRAAEDARKNVVVVEHDGCRAGLEVDGLLGEIQTVIKPMGNLFETVDGVAGSAVLADGRVALVVDVRGVMREVATARGGMRPEHKPPVSRQVGGTNAVVDVAG